MTLRDNEVMQGAIEYMTKQLVNATDEQIRTSLWDVADASYYLGKVEAAIEFAEKGEAHGSSG